MASSGDIVAVAIPRSVELVVALVAILRAGAAYLPLDIGHPADRIARICRGTRPKVILASPAAIAILPPSVPLLVTDDWPREPASADLPPAATPYDLADVIYTSGSTGEPKGVMIEHRAIVNRLLWMREQYGFAADDRILQKTPATFDVSVWEFFLPLLCGGTLVVAPPDAHRDPSAIAALIRSHGVTTVHFVPSMLSAFLAEPAARGLRLRRVFCSGEELSPDLRDRFHQRVDAELHNLYGPTEAAVDISFWEASRTDRSRPVPIGFPVWNSRLYVLDDRQRPVPPGIPGHLHLAGIQLARGYLGRPDLTAERFVPDPFAPGERIYRTGDLARWRQEDGAVVFLGRSDHQVKIRGIRIEPGEIEAAALASGLVRQAAVIAREDRARQRQLIAYVVPGAGFAEDALRAFLAARLPDYMVPGAFVPLEALPVTSNGKLDRSALPAPERSSAGGRAAATPTETALATLYAEVLELPRPVGAEDDFFSLGGDSLLATALMIRIRETFGRDPGLGALFERPDVAGLAAMIETEAPVADSGLNPVLRLSSGPAAAAPLFVMHPVGGIAWCYRHLARALPSRPVFGLQAPALAPGVATPGDLEALAADYVDRMVALAPDGPFHLAGWSVGGIIVQAMAVRLRELGRPVGAVAMLDSYPADCWRTADEPTEADALRALIAVAGHDPDGHPELRTREDIVRFLRNGGSALGGLPDDALDGVIRVVVETNRLVRAHHHRRFDGRVVHFRAALDHRESGLLPDLWAPYVGALDVIDVPFLHPQLAGAEASAILADALDERLAASAHG